MNSEGQVLQFLTTDESHSSNCTVDATKYSNRHSDTSPLEPAIFTSSSFWVICWQYHETKSNGTYFWYQA